MKRTYQSEVDSPATEHYRFRTVLSRSDWLARNFPERTPLPTPGHYMTPLGGLLIVEGLEVWYETADLRHAKEHIYEAKARFHSHTWGEEHTH